MQGRGVDDLPGPTVKGTDHGELFGARLKRQRDTAGLTQDELATRAGLTVRCAARE